MNDSIADRDRTLKDGKIDFSGIENMASGISEDKTTLKDTESNDDVIRRLLSAYDLGQKLRQLRLRKKIALVDLGRHTGLSASMLSQLENGKLVPTLPTLARIAMVFDVGLEHFFSDRRSRRVFSLIRAGERLRFPELADSPDPSYFFEVLAFGAPERSLSAYLAEFPRHDPAKARPHMHDGTEFVYVLAGVLAINYQAEDHILRLGDSVYFDASEAHSYSGQSDELTRAIVVTSLPRL